MHCGSDIRVINVCPLLSDYPLVRSPNDTASHT